MLELCRNCGPHREGFHESRRYSRDTYPESYITEYTWYAKMRLTPNSGMLQGKENAYRPTKALPTTSVFWTYAGIVAHHPRIQLKLNRGMFTKTEA